jgi:protein-tyrosine phosphatase
MQRSIELTGVSNYRDLGGLETETGSTAFGRVIRGESPHNLSDSARQQLLARDVTTVIDLRSQTELEDDPNPFAALQGVNYQHIPLFAALQTHDSSHQATFPPLETIYIAALELCQQAFVQVLTEIALSDGAVLVHCVAGKDRTGLVSMLVAGLAGATEAALLEDYALTANALPLLERLRDQAQAKSYDMNLYSGILSAKPQTMAVVLAHLNEKHGGIVGYVKNTLQLPAEVLVRLLEPQP